VQQRKKMIKQIVLAVSLLTVSPSWPQTSEPTTLTVEHLFNGWSTTGDLAVFPTRQECLSNRGRVAQQYTKTNVVLRKSLDANRDLLITVGLPGVGIRGYFTFRCEQRHQN
jgi:hypothetical protein